MLYCRLNNNNNNLFYMLYHNVLGSLQICSEPVMQKYRILFANKDLSLAGLLVNQRAYTQSLYLDTHTH